MNVEKATFGAGCFWGVETAFRKITGIIDVKVGYMGGHIKNPSYEQICTNTTGHAEVAQITFDTTQIRYEELLRIFWEIHDPTQYNRQGPDIGSQYRSVIFFHTPEQKLLAERAKQHLEKSKKFKKEIVTAILPATDFYPAEEYHQRYFEKHGGVGCPL
jgi:peptide-methionine (S)-S-oxide reductase